MLSPLNDFEAQRLARIAANQQRLRELNLQPVPVVNAPSQRQRRPKDIAKDSERGQQEPTRSSARLKQMASAGQASKPQQGAPLSSDKLLEARVRGNLEFLIDNDICGNEDEALQLDKQVRDARGDKFKVRTGNAVANSREQPQPVSKLASQLEDRTPDRWNHRQTELTPLRSLRTGT